ncbi:MAG: aspartate-semialdehyde dehydrogenase [Pseudomonadota bacterium]
MSEQGMSERGEGFSVAIAGATGAVGQAMLEILEERNFPVRTLHLLASERSAGKRFQFHGKSHRVERLDQFDFTGVDIGLFSAGGSISAEYAPKAAAAGCIVIDNTSQFRYDDEIPLVVPEVNAHALAGVRQRNIIANPNCSTMQMVVALKPIHDRNPIRRITVATYQAVSGAGASGVEELATQTTSLLNMRPIDVQVMARQIAFNAVPHIDTFQDNGYTREEMKMVWETAKIFEDDSIQVNPTCVRVPVFYGHSEAVHLELTDPVDPADVIDWLQHAPGVSVADAADAYPTPVEHAAGTDPVFVGRIRRDLTLPNGLNLWVVADNVRKGAALNTVQIAEALLERGQLAP